jgi:hypothetical protein
MHKLYLILEMLLLTVCSLNTAKMIGRYMVVIAKTPDEAGEMSKECPIYNFVGLVEIRKYAK